MASSLLTSGSDKAGEQSRRRTAPSSPGISPPTWKSILTIERSSIA